MNMSTHSKTYSPLSITTENENKVNHKCISCDEKKKRLKEEEGELKISRKAPVQSGNESTSNKLLVDINAVQSGGFPLDPSTKTFMESRIGHDFSKVRVHYNRNAIGSAKMLDALAYTIQNNIFFGEGKYAPNTHEGKKLIAHELVHVVQQQNYSIFPNHDSNYVGVKVARQSRTPQENEGPRIVSEVPVTFVALPEFLMTGGLSSHVLASGDMSWLAAQDAAARVLSPEYWSSLIPRRGTIELDRIVDELPRDLAPRIESELSGNRLSWLRRGFSEAELRMIPDLVRKLNTQGIESLAPAELAVLRRAAEIHIGGTTAGAPFASYMEPNFELRNVGNRTYRVRIEMPSRNALNVSVPNQFNQGGNLDRIFNADEAEFLATANHEGRIVSVQRGSAQVPSRLMRYSGAIRWGGRILIVGGLALSAHRIITASPEERPVVVGEEAGGMAGGMAGTALAVAGCVALGIATGGLGLFLCGLAGGVLGGVAGSALGGGLVRGLQEGGGSPCPSCHALQRQWSQRQQFDALRNINISGRDSSRDSYEMIVRWLRQEQNH